MSISRLRLGLARASKEAEKANCPRASVGAVVLHDNGFIIGSGYNKRAYEFGECNCNNGVDTTKGGSSTCQAVHAEIGAVMDVASNFRRYMTVLVSTRPPCYQCLSFLAPTDIKMIAVSSEWDDRDGSKQRWVDIGREWMVLH